MSVLLAALLSLSALTWASEPELCNQNLSPVQAWISSQPALSQTEIRQELERGFQQPKKLRRFVNLLRATLVKYKAEQAALPLESEYDLVIIGTGPKATAMAASFTDRLKEKARQTGRAYFAPRILLLGETAIGGTMSGNDFLLNTPEEFVGPGQKHPEGTWLTSNPIGAPLSVGELATSSLWKDGVASITRVRASREGALMTAPNGDRNLFFPSSQLVAFSAEWQAYLSGVQVATGQTVAAKKALADADGRPIGMELTLVGGKKIKAGALIEAVTGRATTEFEVDYGHGTWAAKPSTQAIAVGGEALPPILQVEDLYRWIKSKNLTEEERYDILKDKAFSFFGEGDGVNTAVEQLLGIDPRQPGTAFWKLVSEGRIRIYWYGQKAKTAEEFLARQDGGRSFASRGVYRQVRYAGLAKLFALPQTTFRASSKVQSVRFNPDGRWSIFQRQFSLEEKELKEGEVAKKQDTWHPAQDYRSSDAWVGLSHHVIYGTGKDYQENQQQNYFWINPQYTAQVYPETVSIDSYPVEGSLSAGKKVRLASQEGYLATPRDPSTLRMSAAYDLQFSEYIPEKDNFNGHTIGMQIGFGTVLENPASLAQLVYPARIFAELLADHYFETGSLLFFTEFAP